MRVQLVGLAAVLFMAPSAWAVNKCKGPGGQAVFQDAPCADGGITVAEDIEQKKAAAARDKAAVAPLPGLPPGAASLPPDIQKKLQVAMQESDATLANARATCKREVLEYPVIGMAEEDFKNCTSFGLFVKPETVNETETSAGVARQYVYRSGGIRFLYTRHGKVSAIQR